MSSLSATKALGAAVMLGAALAGCSDIYTDRRETIALHSGDAMATNRVTQMVDPWPRYVGDRNIAFNGEKMQTAHERYRTNRIIQPVSPMTSSAGYQSQVAAPAAAPTQPASGLGNGGKP